MPSTCQPVTFRRPRSLSQGTVMVCKGWSPTPLSPQPLNTWRLPFLPFQPPAKATSSIPSLLSSKGSVLCLLLLLRSALQIILSFLLSSSRHSTRVPVPHHGLQVQPRKRIVSFFPPRENQSTCSNFHPHPIFCPFLVYCLFSQENLHNERDEWYWGGGITQEPAPIQTAAPAPQATNKDFVFPFSLHMLITQQQIRVAA